MLALLLLLPGMEPTYCRDIAPILQRRCQVCHHQGTAAPFALMTYEDAIKHLDSLKEAVADRRMPPWFADPHFGRFKNDPTLTADELRVIAAWEGAEGDKKDLPRPLVFADGFAIGEPDIVLEQPSAQVLPPKGKVDFYRATVDGFAKDVWVEAFDVCPGVPAAVHHLNLFYRLSGEQKVDLIRAHPGRMFRTLEKHELFRIPAGVKLEWEIHYETIGRPVTDRTKIGLRVYRGKEVPRRTWHEAWASNSAFAIPPGANNYEVAADYVFANDAMLLAFSPHMHLRGKDFRYEITLPGRQPETLLFVPRYDWRWQLTYELAAPLLCPKDTRLHCVAHYDNSADNPFNPDPGATVTVAEQADSEMMVALISVIAAPPPSASPVASIARGIMSDIAAIAVRWPASYLVVMLTGLVVAIASLRRLRSGR
jgi:hypothetical protein